MSDVGGRGSHKIAYRPEIDGLRAIAVGAVILDHASFAWIPGGFLGVDIFFVISGYLITGILLNDLAGGTFSFAHFDERRVRRILPADPGRTPMNALLESVATRFRAEDGLDRPQL